MTALEQAKRACDKAESVLITAGAGMGVDSGLPDFRGDSGFWKSYPPYRHLGFNFMAMANPARFVDEPALGWGFYGHRMQLYDRTAPHEGFGLLLEFGRALPGEFFVFTSNVDGHFQRAGCDPNRILECHGSIHHLQCFDDCSGRIWTADPRSLEVDSETMRAQLPLPKCPDCGGLARPNVLMFGDWGWNDNRSAAQQARYLSWLGDQAGQRLVILEFGAGTAVPTVRFESEQHAARPGATLVRVNPREPDTRGHGIELTIGAREAIEAILD